MKKKYSFILSLALMMTSLSAWGMDHSHTQDPQKFLLDIHSETSKEDIEAALGKLTSAQALSILEWSNFHEEPEWSNVDGEKEDIVERLLWSKPDLLKKIAQKLDSKDADKLFEKLHSTSLLAQKEKQEVLFTIIEKLKNSDAAAWALNMIIRNPFSQLDKARQSEIKKKLLERVDSEGAFTIFRYPENKKVKEASDQELKIFSDKLNSDAAKRALLSVTILGMKNLWLENKKFEEIFINVASQLNKEDALEVLKNILEIRDEHPIFKHKALLKAIAGRIDSENLDALLKNPSEQQINRLFNTQALKPNPEVLKILREDLKE